MKLNKININEVNAMTRELTYKQLRNFCDYADFDFNSTKDIEPCKNIIGQKRAAEALEFGLNIKSKGFNIFITGLPGTGKTTFAQKYAKKIAETEKTPDDLIYVYNFENPKEPKLLRFPAGIGKQFKEDMDELINLLTVEIQKAFSSEDYEDEKDRIIKDYENKRDELVKQMTDEAKEMGFGSKIANNGMYFMPIINGEMISEDDFESLNEEERNKISKQLEIIQDKASEIMKIIKEYEKKAKKEIDNIEYQIGLFTIGHYIQKVQDKYGDIEAAIKYINSVKEDILSNIGNFIEDEQEEDESLQMMIPWISRKTVDDLLSKYSLNLIVDNSKTNGAPVIIDYNPNYSNIIGEVEYDNEYGNFTTDFMKIKPGILHKANGGYLIIQALDLFSNAFSWEALKRVLKTKEIVIEPIKENQIAGISVATIKPEPVKADLKIILIGSNYYYEILNEYDDDFAKLFGICSMFDYEMENNKDNIKSIAQFIKNFTVKEKSLEFDVSAIKEVIEYSQRIAERQDKLTTRFSLLNEILAESSTWAKIDNKEIITSEEVKKAISKRIYRINLYEEKYNNMILDNEIMIDTKGKKIGQINGLAVIDMGNYTFGKPTRITATTYMGKCGIVNIEKEAEMSGNIHDKGIQVITGYLGQTYAQEFPLSLSCRICFEQNYNGIDGDSASSTELYAILSSLSNLPLSQEIAVTGSVNQWGDIQPIGGVTYKVEGFFDVCNSRGLTGNQGAIIPEQNIKDLVLKDEVIEAVKNGMFHIYPISHIDEGIEILTGVTAGKRSARGKYNISSVHGKVLKKLRDFYRKSIDGE